MVYSISPGGFLIPPGEALGGPPRVPWYQVLAGLAVLMIVSIESQGLWVQAVVAAQRLAIDGDTMAHGMSVALAFGILGAAMLRLRVARQYCLALIVLGLLLLIWAAWLFGYAESRSLYFAAICLTTLVNGFMLPTLFSVLAELDASGRAPAVGPVAVMGGAAAGAPAVALALANGGYTTFFAGTCIALTMTLALASFAGRRSSLPTHPM